MVSVKNLLRKAFLDIYFHSTIIDQTGKKLPLFHLIHIDLDIIIGKQIILDDFPNNFTLIRFP